MWTLKAQAPLAETQRAEGRGSRTFWPPVFATKILPLQLRIYRGITEIAVVEKLENIQ